MLALADVLRRHWPAYEAKFTNQLLPSHRRAVAAMLSCRTPRLGGQLYRCDCGQVHFAYHSCNHRACPQCGHSDATEWIARQQIKLLPVPYFLATFTVPEELRTLIRSHQKIFYALLFSESAGTLQDIAANPKHLGGELGMLGVLHTWSRQLIYHPHVHYIVAGAGLSSDGLRWLRVRNPDYFLPTGVLARRFRNRLRRVLQQEQPLIFQQIPPHCWRTDWIVDVQPVGSGQGALKYLSAYVYRTALSNQRIVRDEHDPPASSSGAASHITFTYRDSQSGQTRLATVSALEFLRRFLQHVLPRGFQRVRYFGWWSAAAKTRWQRILALLDWKPPPPQPSTRKAQPVWCPRCQQPMRCVGRLARAPP